MDIQQLYLLAGSVRDLLQQSNCPIGHNQSLDLIATLAGLRNWSEVRAFPAWVAGFELDESCASRLALRLKKKFGLDLSSSTVLYALNSADAVGRQMTGIQPHSLNAVERSRRL
jgi:hypothetical protein